MSPLTIRPSVGTQSTAFTNFQRVSGDDHNGVFTGTATLPQYSQNGVWNGELTLEDKLGNSVTLDTAALEAKFGSGCASVLNTALVSDSTPPDVTTFTLTPVAVDTLTGDQTVTVTMTLSDAQTGVYWDGDMSPLTLRPTVGTQSANFWGMHLVSGDDHNGVFSATATLPQGSQTGVWNGELTLEDKLGNSVTLDTAALEAKFGAGRASVLNGPFAGHIITATAGAQGNISPNGSVMVADGADQTFVITPDAHYHIDQLLLGSAPVVAHDNGDGTYSYTVSGVGADATLAVSFAADQVGLTVTTVGQGSVSKDPDQATYDYGSSVQLAVTADPGWRFSFWWGGYVMGYGSSLPVLMNGAQSITATFAEQATVTTPAGSAGSAGSTDGTGSAALFNNPRGVACDSVGNVYVADNSNHTIRKVSPAGVVTTFAGSAGLSGSANGTTAARFAWPSGVACDASDNVYVADTGNETIRKITPGGVVTTRAGSPGQVGSADGAGATARFSSPQGIACDAAGNLYVADTENSTIRKVTPAGVVSTIAGLAGQTGSVNGFGGASRFNRPIGIATSASGTVYVADTTNHTVRSVNPATGSVATLAGLAGTYGISDGPGDNARFSTPTGIACDASGNVFVVDYGYGQLRKVTPAGVVTSIAGDPGMGGSADGVGIAAGFYHPRSVACDAAGTIYVSDMGNSTIRKAVRP
jgi:hypothetical protein